MDSENECSVHESGEYNEEFKKVPVVGKSENASDSTTHNNGSCEVDNNSEDNWSPSDVKGKGTEVSGPENLPSVEITPRMSPSSSSSKKGFGLKKWKRIKRDVSRGGGSRVDSGKMVIQDMSELVPNPSKRTQVYAEKPPKSEGSGSSTNAMVGSLDFLGVLGDSCMSVGLSIDAGADSENSEGQSSKSSTVPSVPKGKYDKSRMRSLSGKNLTHAAQRGQQGKVWSEALKKAREEQVAIKEENSHTSMESDSRSSSFVFMQGTYASRNGMLSGIGVRYDGENGDEVKGNEQQVDDGVSDDYRKDGQGGYEDISPEDGSAESYSKVKTEINENGSSSNEDPLVESIIALHAAQETLEKEVLKFKEININASSDDLVSDTHPEVSPVEQKVGETSSGPFPFGVDIETAKRYAETELEDLFMQKVAAKVEYLTISRTLQNLRAATVNETNDVEERNRSASEKNQILKNHIDAENEGSVKLKKFLGDLASTDETMKLQKKLCKYTSYFFVQLLCFLVILAVFLSELSSDHAEVVPT